MANFVAKKPHTFFRGSSLDIEHLRPLELHETGMSHVKGNRHTGYAVGSEPVVGKPEVRAKSYTTLFELLFELGKTFFQDTAFDSKVEITEAEGEKLIIRVSGPTR
jgi:hypothetical protein